MRNIVAAEQLALDGVVESPEKWTFPYFNDELVGAIGASMAAADTMLLGRRTYQEFAAVWPDRGTDDPVEELTRLKQQPGKNISVVGSPTLVRWLLREGLLDELQLLVYPIVVGTGKRLFSGEGEQVPLKLVDATTFSTGVLSLTYAPADK